MEDRVKGMFYLLGCVYFIAKLQGKEHLILIVGSLLLISEIIPSLIIKAYRAFKKDKKPLFIPSLYSKWKSKKSDNNVIVRGINAEAKDGVFHCDIKVSLLDDDKTHEFKLSDFLEKFKEVL